MMSYKRQMQTGVEQQTVSGDVAALATIGMRIRKAVADGYNVPSNQYVGVNYSRDGYSRGQVPGDVSVATEGHNGAVEPSRFSREPFPSHLSQPPSLLAHGSTMESGSNISEWEMRQQSQSMPVQTLGMASPTGKRKRDDSEIEYNDDSGYTAPRRSIADYAQHYGELKFNEDF